MIKRTILNYLGNYYYTTYFTQYIAENGKSLYTIGNKKVSKKEGNDLFLDLIKNSIEYNVKTNIIETDDQGIIDFLEKGINQYVEYIDNYKEYKSECENNERLYKLIKEFKKIAGIT